LRGPPRPTLFPYTTLFRSDRLHRGDRALRRRGDALLQRAHVGAESRLIPDCRGDAPEQRRHLGTRLGETEDVVDEQEHVLTFLVDRKSTRLNSSHVKTSYA